MQFCPSTHNIAFRCVTRTRGLLREVWQDMSNSQSYSGRQPRWRPRPHQNQLFSLVYLNLILACKLRSVAVSCRNCKIQRSLFVQQRKMNLVFSDGTKHLVWWFPEKNIVSFAFVYLRLFRSSSTILIRFESRSREDEQRCSAIDQWGRADAPSDQWQTWDVTQCYAKYWCVSVTCNSTLARFVRGDQVHCGWEDYGPMKLFHSHW